MKKFEEPILNVEEFEVEDMITTSNDTPACENEAGEFSLR